jgi:transcriptional regulator with XRE-family HTH domain
MTHLFSGDRATGESSTYMNTTIQIASRQRLVAERLRRRWTQLEVADQLGTTPGNVSRWERGITSPGPYFRRKLCELFGSSAQELGLSWDESDDSLSHHTQASSLAASFQGNASPRNHPSFTGREVLLALLHTLIRPETTTALSSVPANSRLGELNLPEQENGEQGRPAQAVEQWLQAGLNRVLIPVNAGAVVFVVLNNNVDTRPSSLHEGLSNRHTTRRGDCCDEYPPMRGTLRQRQGA